MKSKSTAKPETQHDTAALVRCYGQIGIPAVAAALPYQSDAKNPAYSPVVWQRDERFAETAA
jgi:hypothetical protein